MRDRFTPIAIGLIAAVTAGCSAAEAELARMQDVPQVVSIDANGDEIAMYDPAEITPDGDVDLFADAPGQGPPAADEAEGTADEAAESVDGTEASPSTTTVAGDDQANSDPTTTTTAPPTGVPVIVPTIVERYPHDGAAFTQGLEFADGALIESLGILGESARRRVAPTSGEVVSSVRLSDDEFGAGLTVVGNQIIQLTWQQGVAIVSDLTTLIELSRVSYEGEGWGLCSLDDDRLVMSNGSGLLTFRDGSTFEPTGEQAVTLDGEPVENLNELECVADRVYANVWLTSDIYEIDVASGAVQRIIDASDLVPGDLGPDDVLNGIAYRAETDTFFLTGKRWTVMYEVSLS